MIKRIVVYFLLLILFLCAFFSYTVISFAGRILEMTLINQLNRAVAAIAEDPLLLQPKILPRLKGLLEAEIFVYDEKGKLVATTSQTLMRRVPSQLAPELLKDILAGKQAVIRLPGENPSLRQALALIRLPGDSRLIISLVSSEALLNWLKKKLVIGVLYTAFSGFFFSLAVAYHLGLSLGRPLEKLCHYARRISQGETGLRLPEEGPSEIKELARAFNEMLTRLREYQQRLLEAERQNTAAHMAASFAHEIKNPLTSLKIAGMMLAEDLKDEEAKRRAQVIVRECRRIERIVQEMLERTRKMRLEQRSVTLARVIRETTEAVCQAYPQIDFHLDLDSSVQAFVDPDRIRQVLWNLILNAAEAMDGQGRITISLKDEQQPEIIIEDEGPGIPPEVASRLFSPFFTTKKDGTGLGLTISRQIIEAHGGKLLLENRSPKGARARIILPPSSPQP
ncbi:ATP-binding protein [Thermosulfuriphilus sp.]